MSICIDIEKRRSSHFFTEVVNSDTNIEESLHELSNLMDVFKYPLKVTVVPLNQVGRQLLPLVQVFEVHSNMEENYESPPDNHYYKVSRKDLLLSFIRELHGKMLLSTTCNFKTNQKHIKSCEVKSTEARTGSTGGPTDGNPKATLPDEIKSSNSQDSICTQKSDSLLSTEVNAESTNGSHEVILPDADKCLSKEKSIIRMVDVPSTGSQIEIFHGMICVPSSKCVSEQYAKAGTWAAYHCDPNEFAKLSMEKIRQFKESPMSKKEVFDHLCLDEKANFTKENIQLLLKEFVVVEKLSCPQAVWAILWSKYFPTSNALEIAERWYCAVYREGDPIEGMIEQSIMMQVVQCTDEQKLRLLSQLSGTTPEGFVGACELCRSVNSHSSSTCIRYFTYALRKLLLQERNQCIGCGDIECNVNGNAPHRPYVASLDWCAVCGKQVKDRYHLNYMCDNTLHWDMDRVTYNQLAALYIAIKDLDNTFISVLVKNVFNHAKTKKNVGK